MLVTFTLIAVTLTAAPIPDFKLPDTAGTGVRLSDFAKNRPCVVVFLGVDCPMANLYAGRLNKLASRFSTGAIAVLAIDSQRGDDLPAMVTFAQEHNLTFPFLRDADGRVAASFGATRTPEAFLLDAARHIRYRGRIDDQYAAVGKNRGRPTREDLVEAVREILAGKPVTVPATQCTGCRISPPSLPAAPRVTYSRDIAPILATHCQECHRPGEVGPFALLSYTDAVGHAATIAEVVANGTMPPWHASPGSLRFRNERRLSDAQKRLIAEWVALGCPEGNPESQPITPELPPAGDWKIGKPDAVFSIPREFTVPAEGIVEYQHFNVDTGFATDVWVSAIEIRPGNRRVVHHCSVFLQPPGVTGNNDLSETGALGSFFLGGITAGTDPVKWPTGMAKRIPAGWHLHIVIHYSAVGTPQTDRTEVGLRLIGTNTLRKEVATKLLLVNELLIPPHAANHRVEQTWTAPQDVLLLSMFPHMHLRGKSARYTAEYPDGSSELLLDVPQYDFNWQHWYQLTVPKRLPAGTVLRGVTVYDNSAANPFNPDPSATVRTGEQTSDEMFNMYFDIVLADQDIPAERAAAEVKQLRARYALIGSVTLMGLWGLRLWRKGRTASVTAAIPR